MQAVREAVWLCGAGDVRPAHPWGGPHGVQAAGEDADTEHPVECNEAGKGPAPAGRGRRPSLAGPWLPACGRSRPCQGPHGSAGPGESCLRFSSGRVMAGKGPRWRLQPALRGGGHQHSDEHGWFVAAANASASGDGPWRLDAALQTLGTCDQHVNP